MITITNNYFQDLNAALEAGIIAKVGGKNPKKADLYEAIEAHNAAATPEPVVSPVDEVALQDELLALDAIEDAAKAEQRSNVKAPKQPRQPKELHLAACGNKAVKPGTKVALEIELLRNGSTKEEILEGLGWKNWSCNRSAALECGYGIRRDSTGKYWLVESLRAVA